jgi:hypothetical protein
LNKVALSVHATMKTDLREIYLAPSRTLAAAAIDVFAEKYRAKHDKAVDCLIKDRRLDLPEGHPIHAWRTRVGAGKRIRESMLAFFDFPAEHWDHLRTTDEMDKQFLAGLLKMHSFVRPRRRHSSAPTAHLAAAARRGGQGWPPFAATARLGLDRPEHGGILDRIGPGKHTMVDRPSVPGEWELARPGDCYCRARVTSWRRAARRL